MIDQSAATESVLVIACGAIAHELVAVMQANRFDHIDVQCLPAKWHNTPAKIAPAIEHKLQSTQGCYSHTLVAYGDCGTGGELDKVLEKFNVERLPGDHCYSFFAGATVFDAMAEAELGTFYLTDYLVDNFQQLIMDGLGISRHPELRHQYFAHYKRVMYLAQGNQDNQSDKQLRRLASAEQAAEALQLELAVHFTGLDPFEHALRVINIAGSPTHFQGRETNARG